MLCKVCVSEKPKFVCLWNLCYGKVSASSFINDILQIKLNLDDNPQSQYICTPCNDVLSAFYEFYCMVRETHERLQDVKEEDGDTKDPLTSDQQDTQQHQLINDQTLTRIKEELDVEYEDTENTFDDDTCFQSEFLSCEIDPDTKTEVKKSIRKTRRKTLADEQRELRNKQIKNEDSKEADLKRVKLNKSDGAIKKTKLGKVAKVKGKKDKKKLKKEKIVSAAKSKFEGSIVTLVKNRRFYDSKRTHEANNILLSKYKLEDICREGKWLLKGDAFNDAISLYVDLKCSKCPALPLFTSYSQLLEHSRVEHESEVTVRCCDKQTEKQSDIEKHLLYYHLLKKKQPTKPTYIPCPICNKIIKKSARKVHLTAHLPTELRQFRCTQCNYGCGTQGLLTWHMKIVHPPERVPCDQCDKTFKTLKALEYHKDSKHNPVEGPKEFLCQDCGKSFKTYPILRYHIKRIHTNTNQGIKCGDCDQIVKVTTYKHHQHKHKYSKQCPHCPYIGECTSDHIKRVHLKERRYSCPYCPMQFYSKHTMADHVASRHTGIPRYTCEFCDKTFNTSGNFHAHRKKMHSKEVEEKRMSKKLKDREKKNHLVEIKSIPPAPSKRYQVVENVDLVLKNIEEVDKREKTITNTS